MDATWKPHCRLKRKTSWEQHKHLLQRHAIHYDELNKEPKRRKGAACTKITQETMKKAAQALLRNTDLNALTLHRIHHSLCDSMQVHADNLEENAQQMQKWMDELVQKEMQLQLEQAAKRTATRNRSTDKDGITRQCRGKRRATENDHLTSSKVGDTQVLQAYLVTWSAPTDALVGTMIQPHTYSREQTRDIMLQTLASCQEGSASAITVKRMAVFRESHKSGKDHYHIAILLSGKKRWKPWRQKLQSLKIGVNFATCDVGGYHSAIRYCYMPRQAKPLDELDPTPLLHPQDHPPLFEAMNRNYTAESYQEEKILLKKIKAEQGQAECRFKEVDLWPILKAKQWRPDDDNFVEKLLLYARESGGNDMINFCIRNYETLASIAYKIWVMEEAPLRIESSKRTRIDMLHDATKQECKCHGRWPRAARDLLRQNDIDESSITTAIFNAMLKGRSKNNCVCLCGRYGNEGKSFMLAPLAEIFSADQLFRTPSPGNFPLLGIEHSRVLLWDDWRWNESTLKIQTLLLLLEGQPLHVPRPQNRFGGHFTWTGTSPVFITGRVDDLNTPKGMITEQDLSMVRNRTGRESGKSRACSEMFRQKQTHP